jgi:predicted permease
VPIQLNETVLAATVGVSLAIAGAMSLVPLELLRNAGMVGGIVNVRGAATRGRLSAKLSDAMAGAQIAIAFVLLIGAGLLLTSLRNVLAVDPGFAADQVVEGRLDFTTIRTFYPSRDDAGRLKQRIVEAMRGVPGVDNVGLSMFPMLSHDLRAGGRSFTSLGGPAPGTAAAETFSPSGNYVSPGFFVTMGIPILDGRACGPEDTARSVVVDELLAQRMFGDVSPVGLEITTAISGQPERVIGVSGRANLRGPEQRDMQPFYYRCEPVERGWWEYSILLRTSRNPTDVIREMRDRVREIDPRLPLSHSNSLREAVDETLVVRRAVTMVGTAFAVLALFLSLVGVFAVLASSVVERRREIGIRIAVGAHRRDVYRLILTKGLQTTSIGLGVGALGAATLSGFLERFLFDVAPSDAVTYLAAGGLFVIAALLACLLPARQAAGVDPLRAVDS